MFADALMALVIALIFQMFSLVSKRLERILIWLCCVTIIIVYFASGCKIDFIGKTDLAVCLAYTIAFDGILTFAKNKLIKFINKKNKE